VAELKGKVLYDPWKRVAKCALRAENWFIVGAIGVVWATMMRAVIANSRLDGLSIMVLDKPKTGR